MTTISRQNTQPEPLVRSSLGLRALLGLLRTDEKYFILDLGKAVGTNVEFWSRLQCRLHIEDFYHGYSARVARGSEDSRAAIFAELLSFSPATCFDVILAWDLFNYFDPGALEALIGKLSTWCRPGTLLFALISSQPQIPAEPTLFRILDSERMLYETQTQKLRSCPRHQPRDLARLMARFDVSSSFLLRHGIQEYVFVYR